MAVRTVRVTVICVAVVDAGVHAKGFSGRTVASNHAACKRSRPRNKSERIDYFLVLATSLRPLLPSVLRRNQEASDG